MYVHGSALHQNESNPRAIVEISYQRPTRSQDPIRSRKAESRNWCEQWRTLASHARWMSDLTALERSTACGTQNPSRIATSLRRCLSSVGQGTGEWKRGNEAPSRHKWRIVQRTICRVPGRLGNQCHEDGTNNLCPLKLFQRWVYRLPARNGGDWPQMILHCERTEDSISIA